MEYAISSDIAATIAILAYVGLVFAAGLEAVFAFCLGCFAFEHLMRFGIIPESVCEDCADFARRDERQRQAA